MCCCMHARADFGRCASVQFAPSTQFGCILYTYCIYCIYILTIFSVASTMTNNQNVLEHFGGVDANSLCQLLNNNDDNGHPDDEPNIVQTSSYYDDDSLNNLFKDK